VITVDIRLTTSDNTSRFMVILYCLKYNYNLEKRNADEKFIEFRGNVFSTYYVSNLI